MYIHCPVLVGIIPVTVGGEEVEQCCITPLSSAVNYYLFSAVQRMITPFTTVDLAPSHSLIMYIATLTTSTCIYMIIIQCMVEIWYVP